MDDRREIEEVVTKFGLLIDARDWRVLEGILTQTIALNYVSLFGGSPEKILGSQLMERWKSFVTSLKATQHMITNLLITIKEAGIAECVADVVATHVKPNPMGDPLWVVGGRYDFELTKRDGRWRISSIKLSTYWMAGNPQILSQS